MKKYSYKKKSFVSSVRFKKTLGVLILSSGLLFLLYLFFPLLSFHLYLSSVFANSNFEAPLPQRYVLKGESSIGALLSSGISNVTHDFTDARNWFPEIENVNVNEKVNEYELSIPSQGIERAKVKANDFDLSSHLVQYFSTSKNPTDKGTSVIFGHSTLPQLFDPKNYKAIFAKMHTMKVGEEFVIHLNGFDYTYRIFAIDITEPDDPNIFSQSFDNSYITLVTCTPPGTVWKRLILRASLLPRA